jgi:chromosome segregation ATPase
VATEGGDSPAVETSRAADADVVITTVVSADEPRVPAAPQPVDEEADPMEDVLEDDLAWGWAEDDILAPPRAASEPAAVDDRPDQLAALEARLAALEGVPATVDTLGKAIRHELERCAGVLFGHDRALGTLASRLDAVETVAPAPAASDIDVEGGPDLTKATDEAVAALAEAVRDFDRRLVAMETRVEPLEPLPTVVQALRRAVRASDDLLAGETAAREQALTALAGQQATEAQARDDALRRLVAQDLDRVSAVSNAQAKGLVDLAERVAAAESRLGPLVSVPDDIAALSRILRRELDAIVTDNQARDQMLRRALQNEIDQLRSTSEARDAAAQELTARLDALETRTAEVAGAADAAASGTGLRLDVLETRISAVDRIGTQLDALNDTVTRELEQLRAGGRAHDQLAGELTRRLSALDAQLGRLEPLPGEMQSLRTAMLQEAERTVTALRAADERIGQLAWVPGEFQEARKRIMALTSGVQTSQDRVRQLEAALISVNERMEAMRARISAASPPLPPG